MNILINVLAVFGAIVLVFVVIFAVLFINQVKRDGWNR